MNEKLTINKKHVIGYAVTAVIALGVGATSAGGGSTGATAAGVTAAGAGSTPTATVTVPGSTATVAGPVVTKTVTVQAPAKTVTAAPPKAAVSMPGDGTYQVGVDVQPGTYVSDTPSSGNCYWARLSGSDGLGSIIDNNNSSGRSVVTIRKGDKFFESSGCSDWTKR